MEWGRLAGGTDNISTGAVSFLSSTPSGVQAVFNTSGALQEQAAYSTYGEQVIQSGTKVTPFGFQGTYTTASGLDYMVNRYLTPTTDQFLSVDPMLAETGQPYAFTGDDPLNETDPLGLKGWYCKNGKTQWFKHTNTGLANGKCGAGTTTPYAHYYRESEFAAEYEHQMKVDEYAAPSPSRVISIPAPQQSAVPTSGPQEMVGITQAATPSYNKGTKDEMPEKTFQESTKSDSACEDWGAALILGGAIVGGAFLFLAAGPVGVVPALLGGESAGGGLDAAGGLAMAGAGVSGSGAVTGTVLVGTCGG